MNPQQESLLLAAVERMSDAVGRIAATMAAPADPTADELADALEHMAALIEIVHRADELLTRRMAGPEQVQQRRRDIERWRSDASLTVAAAGQG